MGLRARITDQFPVWKFRLVFISRDFQRDNCGHRCARGNQSRCLAWHAHNLRGPTNDLLFNHGANMVASAAIGIHCSARHFGEDIRRRARPVHPAEKARMRIARRIGHNRFKVGAHLLCANPALRQRRIYIRLKLFGNRRPNTALARILHFIKGGVEHSMGGLTESRPVFRVKCHGVGIGF